MKERDLQRLAELVIEGLRPTLDALRSSLAAGMTAAGESPPPLEVPEPWRVASGHEGGQIYVVQPCPDVASGRIKIGFTTFLSNRLHSFQSICPTLRLIGLWPGDRQAERIALAAVVGRRVGGEVFDVADPQDALDRIAFAIDRYRCTGAWT